MIHHTNTIKGYILAMVMVLCLFPSSIKGENAPDSLTLSNFDLDEVVITATRIPKLLKDVPIQTRLISSLDIERTDATNIEDLLQQEMPGVEFSYAMNQQTHLNFSGQGGQSILFLVDGERLAGETMDDVDFSRLELNNIEKIEIVKGASSAIYGSSAGGGVINIITKQASRKWNVNASARYAPRHNDQRYRFSLSNKTSWITNNLSVAYNTIDNYDVTSAEAPKTRVISTIYGNSVWNFNDKFTIIPIKNIKITGRIGYYFRELSRMKDSPERYRDYSAGLKGEWNISESDNIYVSYAFDQYDKSDFYRISRLDIRSYSNVQNSLRSLYNHTFNKKNTLSIGADFMRDYMLNAKLSDQTHAQLSFDVFAQYDWVCNPKWEFVGALRYDYFSDGKNSMITPKLSALYRPINNINLRMGYGMGFRAPSLKEKYYEFDMVGIWIVKGNQNLRPESSHNFNISADYTYSHFNFMLSAYYNNIHNRITTGIPYYNNNTQLYLDYVNLKHYNVYGAEANVQAKWENGISTKISYAFTKENMNKDKSGNAIANQYIPARKHSLTLRVDWDKHISKKYAILASINGRFLSSVDNIEYVDYYDISKGTTNISYPAYTIWKFSLNQLIADRFKITLSIDNIFNYKPKYYYLNCPLTDGINFMAGISIELF